VSRIALSPYSKVFWMEYQLDPLRTDYHMLFDHELTGDLDIDRLDHSLQCFIQDHLLINSHIVSISGDLFWESNKCVFPMCFFDTLDEIEGFIQQPFNLEQGPLYRYGLMKISDSSYRLVIVFHHAVIDGRAVDELMARCSSYYNDSLPNVDLKKQYQCVVQANQTCQHKVDTLDYTLVKNFLKQYFSSQQDQCYFHDLSMTSIVDDDVDYQEGCHFSLSAKVLADGAGSQRYSSTFNVLLLVWGVLIARYVNQTSCVIAYPYGVGHSDLSLGCQVNTLLMPVDFSHNENFDELYHTSMSYISDMRSCSAQNLPIGELLDKTGMQMTNFGFSQALANHRQPLYLDSVDSHIIDNRMTLTNNVIILFYVEHHGELYFQFGYDASKISVDIVHCIQSSYVRLLKAVIQDPNAPVLNLPIISYKQYKLITQHWNNTAVDFPHVGIHKLFEKQVLKTPTKVALLFNDQTMTYEELDHRANQLAQRILGELNDRVPRGVSTIKRIALCFERSFDMVITLLAVLKTGSAYVPIDPEVPHHRMQYIIAKTQASLLLTHTSFDVSLGVMMKGLGANAIPLFLVDKVVDNNTDLVFNSQSVASTSLAYIMFTSGTTGSPKGVMIEHGSVVNRLQWMQKTFPLQPHDRILQKTNYIFDVSVWEFFWPLLNGAQLVLAEPSGHRDQNYIFDVIKHFQITKVHFVPSMLNFFLESIADKHRSERIGLSLDHLFVSGELLSVSLAHRLSQLLDVSLYNLYGPTEACIEVSYYHYGNESCYIGSGVPIGFPIDNVKLYILNHQFQLCPIGVIGQLYISGVGLARGYDDNSQLTQQVFITNPFYEPARDENYHSRLYQTGDFVRWLSDGSIEYIGRIDHQVKIRGYRVECGEIEHVLCQQDGVSQAVVLSQLSPDSEAILVAYITVDGLNNNFSQACCYAGLQAILPAYMLPSRVILCDEIPVNSIGKVDRQALHALSDMRRDVSQLPRTADEIQWAQLWCQVLGNNQVGVNENFFSLGGNSLKAIQLVELASSKGLNITPQKLFTHPTIEQLLVPDLAVKRVESSSTLLEKAMKVHDAPIMGVNLFKTKISYCMIHPGIGGALTWCQRLARCFAGHQSSYIIDSYNLYHLDNPKTSIPLLAKHYLQSIRTLQPYGPYILLGWSLGGVIAVEVAHQLQAMGESISGIVLIDSYHLTLKQHHMLSYVWDDNAMQAVFEKLIEIGDSISMEKLLALNQIERDMSKIYQSRRLYDVPVLLIRATDLGMTDSLVLNNALGVYRRLFDSPSNGWSGILGDLTIQDIATDHLTLMRSPFVEQVASRIQSFLYNAS